MLRRISILPWLVISAVASAASGASTPGVVVALKGPINAYSQGAFVRQFERARSLGAKVVIIDLDTYGGAVTSALELSHFIKSQREMRVVAYVNPKAYSAGSMIAVACNAIHMAPTAALGDCAPIAVSPTGGLQPLGPTERAKIESPILADFEDSALRNGYDPLLVQSMVSLNRVVHWVEKEGARRFVDGKGYAQLVGEGWKPVEGMRDPVTAADALLTVTTEQAIKLGLAKGSSASVAELAQSLDVRVLMTFEPGFGERMLGLLNSDSVRLILLIAFLVSLYAAMHAPGHGFAEAGAVLSLAILLGVPLMTGYAQWWEIAAILLGIGLLAIELFVIPGFGITGLIGIGLILGGLVLTFIAPEPGRSPLSIPQLAVTWSALRRGLSVVVVGMIASLLLCWWLRRYLAQLPYFSRLILTTTVGTESAMVGSLTNIDPSELAPGVGAYGTAVTDLRPGGSAEFRDAAGGSHIVSVVSDSGFVSRGAELVVREVSGNRVVVRPVQQ